MTVNDIEPLRQALLRAATDGERGAELARRLEAFEQATRRDERGRTLVPVRHSLHTLRSLMGFLRQELEQGIEPLKKLCDEVEEEIATVDPPAGDSAPRKS